MNHNALIDQMIQHEEGVPNRIQHFLKVHAFAKLIGEEEGLSEKELLILETASIVHDIGIRPAMKEFGSGAGPYQEKLGAPLAYEMISGLGYEEEVAKRASVLVGRHHTYTGIDGMDCQILIEADFLVNLFEGNEPVENILKTRETIFKTKAGTRILNTMFGLREK